MRSIRESSLLSALYGVSSHTHLYGFTRAQRMKIYVSAGFSIGEWLV